MEVLAADAANRLKFKVAYKFPQTPSDWRSGGRPLSDSDFGYLTALKATFVFVNQDYMSAGTYRSSITIFRNLNEGADTTVFDGSIPDI